MPKISFIATPDTKWDVRTEDCGQHKEISLCDEDTERVHAKLCSWDEYDEEKNPVSHHPELDQFVGKKIKVTFETVD